MIVLWDKNAQCAEGRGDADRLGPLYRGLRLRAVSKYYSFKNISKFLRRLPPRRRSSKLLPISWHSFRFCVFFYFFRSVFRDSAISSSDSRGSHFGSSLGNKQLGGSSWKEVLPKQPRFHENIPSINLV